MILSLIFFSLITTTFALDCNSCSKLWGMTNKIADKPVYTVDIYMCINDPYNIYSSQNIRSY